MKTEDDRFKLKVGGRLNFGYTHGFLDSTADYSSFDILRAKLFFGGNVFSPDVQFYVQTASASNSRPAVYYTPSEATDGRFTLEDFYVRLTHDHWNVKLGQFKVPFARQWMIYSGNLQFTDRSLPTKYFLLGRDRGVLIGHDRDFFSASAGVFNGAGPQGLNAIPQPNVSNDSSSGRGHLYVGRVSIRPFGEMNYSEGDVENSEGQRLEWGASMGFDHDRDVDVNGDTLVDDPKAEAYHAATDLTWKVSGFSASGEGFYRSIRSNVTGNINAYGFYGQTGYMILPSTLELAGRFAWLDLSTANANDVTKETSAVMNLYMFSDHRYKIQTQYTWRSTQLATGTTRNDHFADLMFQLTI